MGTTATITFIDQHKRVSAPVYVPKWSTITLTCQPGQPTIYMGSDKVVLYSGPYQVDGKEHEAPLMRPMPARTRVMSPVVHPTRPIPGPRSKSKRTVTLPLWLFVLFVAALYTLYGTTLWFALD
jgi:hypothetical protein